MQRSVILAAGMGLRLNISRAKPLTLVNNISLLLRTLFSHEVAGCEETMIVLGSKAEVIKEHICSKYNGSIRLHFTINHKYNLKNGVSVLAAESFIENEFLLTMADHILDDRIMLLAKKHRPPTDGASLCVDYKINSIFDLDDATKVLAEKGSIKQIGKHLTVYDCIDTGVFIATRGLLDSLSAVYKEKGDVSLSEGVQVLAKNGKMTVLDIKDAFWQDVDTPEMLAQAELILKKNRSHSE